MKNIIQFFYSLSASALARETIRVSFDGQDWVHVWENESFFNGVPVLRPKRQLSANMEIFTRHYIPKIGDIVVDVGAGAGTEVPFFANAVGVEGKVYAIEPDFSAFRRLRKHIYLQRYDNVIPINLAVSSNNGFGKILSKFEGDIGGQLKIVDSRIDSESTFEVKTLDSIIFEFSISKIDYIKINVEGHELEVLQGLQQNLHLVNKLCISCHDFLGPQVQPTLVRVKKWLNENGFSIDANPYEHRNDYLGLYVYATRTRDSYRP